jgi:hypothetical protein
MHPRGWFSGTGGACVVALFAAFLMIAAERTEARANPYDIKPSPLTEGDKKPAPPPAVVAPAKILGADRSLRVHRIRLEAGPAAAPSPSSTLKFEMLNDGASRLRNIVVEVSVVKRVREVEPKLPAEVVVRPFIVRENVVLQPGYSIEYEVRFQNLAPDCDCVPRVDVVSVEALADPDPSR